MYCVDITKYNIRILVLQSYMQCVLYSREVLYIRTFECTVQAQELHSLLFSSDALNTTSLTQISVPNSKLTYYITRNNDVAGPLIAGYEVTRFGVPMIGQYVNTGTGRRVTINPVVAGAQYRITAWALGDGRRSATPAVVDATTGEESKTIVYL